MQKTYPDHYLLHMRLYLAFIAVLAVALLGIIASGTTQWYLQYPYFDKVLHLVGGFVIAWLIAILFVNDIRKISLAGSLILIVGGTVLVGVGWEIAEYFSNTWFADAVDGWQATAWRYFRGGDLKDTLQDLGADAGGALILAGLFLPVARRKS